MLELLLPNKRVSAVHSGECARFMQWDDNTVRFSGLSIFFEVVSHPKLKPTDFVDWDINEQIAYMLRYPKCYRLMTLQYYHEGVVRGSAWKRSVTGIRKEVIVCDNVLRKGSLSEKDILWLKLKYDNLHLFPEHVEDYFER